MRLTRMAVPWLACVLYLLIGSMLAVGESAAADQREFPSNAELGTSNVALIAHTFDFASGLRPDDNGKPNCQGLDLVDAGEWASGFIVKSNGTLVTNYHVVHRAVGMRAVFKDGGSYEINNMMAYDPVNDLAILKISGERTFPTVELGDSGTLEPQDNILAVGNPKGLGLSVSFGQVSQVMKHDSGQAFAILHTAAIAPGNSGGALYKGKKVVGVNVAKVVDSPAGGGSGFNLAIPINLVKKALSDPQYMDQAVPLTSVFPPSIVGIAKKAKELTSKSVDIPAATEALPGSAPVPFKFDRFDDLLIVLKSDSKNVGLIVFDADHKMIGCGDYTPELGFAPLLMSSDYSQDVVIGAINFEKSPVKAELKIYTIDW